MAEKKLTNLGYLNEHEHSTSENKVSHICSAHERLCDARLETQQRRRGNSLEKESRRSAGKVKKCEKKLISRDEEAA